MGEDGGPSPQALATPRPTQLSTALARGQETSSRGWWPRAALSSSNMHVGRASVRPCPAQWEDGAEKAAEGSRVLPGVGGQAVQSTVEFPAVELGSLHAGPKAAAGSRVDMFLTLPCETTGGTGPACAPSSQLACGQAPLTCGVAWRAGLCWPTDQLWRLHRSSPWVRQEEGARRPPWDLAPSQAPAQHTVQLHGTLLSAGGQEDTGMAQ